MSATSEPHKEKKSWIPARKRRAKLPTQRRVKWHESMVVRSAGMVSFIILCGYLASVSISIQSIQAVSQIAHDPEVETLLSHHLKSIKQIHSLKQDILILRLKTIIPPQYRTNPADISETLVKNWLTLSQIEATFSQSSSKIRELSGIEKLQYQDKPPIMWISRSKLKIYRFLAEVDDEKIMDDFLNAEGLKQRYQLIGATWNDKIKPTFVQANAIIMIITFFIFTGSLLLIARRLKKRIEGFILGFNVWAERDSTFRFSDSWAGELRTISQQFNLMADEVEANRKRTLYLEKMSSWQIIARKLAHEIKNPLTPIQMMISQVVRQYDGSSPTFQSLLSKCHTIIVEEVNRLRHMVDNFSKFAQLPDPKFENNNLVDLCQQTLELEKAAYPQHTFTFKSNRDNVIAQCDKDLIKQALLNLIKNSAEACGQQPAHIGLELVPDSHHFTIRVSDDGPGVPIDLQNRIFEAYFTTKNTGPSPGMGLGLAICQKIIIDHDGDLQLTSRPGSTCFSMKIPKRQKGIANGSSP